jgi:hypothetical protein
MALTACAGSGVPPAPPRSRPPSLLGLVLGAVLTAVEVRFRQAAEIDFCWTPRATSSVVGRHGARADRSPSHRFEPPPLLALDPDPDPRYE